MAVVQLENINKSFSRGFLGRSQQVLTNLCLEIGEGEVFGLLGHNGSGKTTTMRIILGLLSADSGNVRLFGRPGGEKSARARIGYLSDQVGLYPYFNAEEMLDLTGALFRMDPKDIRAQRNKLLEAVGLADSRRRRIGKYSKGMRQRLGIAVALLNDPQLLILDEPYSGLDPIGRRELRQLLVSLKARGKTILLSSHIVPDVEAVCDRVGILRSGQIRKCLDLHSIYEQKSTPAEVTVSGVDPETFEGMDGTVELIVQNDQAIVFRCAGSGLVKKVVSKTYAIGGDVLEIKPLKFNLEDYLYRELVDAIDEEDTARSPERKEKAYANSQ